MVNSSDKAVRVGIAGLGRSGWNIHAKTISELSDLYRVVAVTDPDVSRCQEAVSRFGCQAHADFQQLVLDDRVELVVVAVPSHLHPEYTVRALRAGKHVLVEKPMANDLRDVDRMIEAARAADRILTVNQNYRNMAGFLQVQDVLRSGVLGRIVMIRIAWHGFGFRWDWQTLKEFNGGQLNNAGTHVVDRALLLMGDVEPSVYCRMETTPVYAGDAESHVKIVLEAPGAPMVDIELTSVCAYPQDEWLVMGTRGGLTGDHSRIQWKYYDPASRPLMRASCEPTPDRSYNRAKIEWQEECYELPKDRDPMGYLKTYRDLYGSLRNGESLAITPESVRRQIAILDECRRQNPI